MTMKKTILSLGLVGLMAGFAPSAQADKLDDIMNGGVLRCAVVLDFPPIGFRDANNQPVGYDVDMCTDLAAALDVDPEIVEVTWAERIPALISGRADVAVASSSDTLERAKTVSFSIPYIVYQFQVLTTEGANITDWEQLKSARVGAAIGTTYESLFLEYKEKNWPDATGSYTSYQSENESIVALAQGQVDAIIITDVAIRNHIEAGTYANLQAGPVMPVGEDMTGMMVVRGEFGLRDYLNLFINRQVRSGRYEELYRKWLGGEPPSLVVPGVYY